MGVFLWLIVAALCPLIRLRHASKVARDADRVAEEHTRIGSSRTSVRGCLPTALLWSVALAVVYMSEPGAGILFLAGLSVEFAALFRGETLRVRLLRWPDGLVVSAGSGGVRTGDASFDAEVAIEGEGLHGLATLSANNRHQLRAIAQAGWTVHVDGSATRELRLFESVRPVLNELVKRIDRMDVVLDSSEAVVARLAVDDPHPGVRARMVKALVDQAPQGTETERLATALLHDLESPADALDGEESVARAALWWMQRHGQPGDVEAIRAHAQGVLAMEARAAIAAIHARVGGDVSGRLSESVVSDVRGGLSESDTRRGAGRISESVAGRVSVAAPPRS